MPTTTLNKPHQVSPTELNIVEFDAATAQLLELMEDGVVREFYKDTSLRGVGPWSAKLTFPIPEWPSSGTIGFEEVVIQGQHPAQLFLNILGLLTTRKLHNLPVYSHNILERRRNRPSLKP